MPDVEEQEPAAASPAPLPRSMWLLSDNRRSVIATIAATVLAAVVITVAIARSPQLAALPDSDTAAFVLFSCVVVWTLLALVHTALTWYTYRDLRDEDFQRSIVADPSWIDRERLSRSRLVRWTVGYGPSSWSVSVSTLALVVVFTMVLRPALREIPLALSLSLVMVAASWANVGITYAVHYARVDITDGGLRFPGESPAVLQDYLYFAVGVMTTFATADVDVQSRPLRSLVTGQGILAFVFNSVIVAMLLSLLLGAT